MFDMHWKFKVRLLTGVGGGFNISKPFLQPKFYSYPNQDISIMNCSKLKTSIHSELKEIKEIPVTYALEVPYHGLPGLTE